ncbi:MAG: DegV family protein [Dehalococcoidia bacterium]|nr:DegV family protein [Dehalococcoidia bacterium]
MCNGIAIVTDTVSSLPEDMAEEYGVSVIPMHIIMDGKDYLETEVDKEQFYTWFENEREHPKTSAPSVGAYLEVFRKLCEESKQILCITMSSGISTTYKIALQARDIIREEYPFATIEVVDSYNEHGALMFVVLEAARAASEGKPYQEVLRVADGMIKKVTLFYLLNTLYHLKVGGRMGKANIWGETALSLKPLLELGIHTEGVMVPVARLRTKSMGNRKVVEVLEEGWGGAGCTW